MIGSILAGLATGGVSNVLSEWHADKAQNREKELMDYQNSLNKANAMDAYRNTVQGMKMAGLNPALAENSQPVQAPSVSKGQGAKGENVEFDPNIMLLDAQRENLEAQTAKTEAETAKISGVDTKNVEADTALKTAQKLLGEANKDKVSAETENIKNVNKVWNDENDSLATFGQTMAQKWVNEKWFNSLAPDTKSTIQSMADGELVMTIGGMNALEKTIAAQKNLSDADRALIKNAFDNVITESMFKDKKVMEALAKMPEVEQKRAKAQTSELIQSARVHGIDADYKTTEYNSRKFNDPDWTWNEFWEHPSAKNFVIWLQASYSDKLNSLRQDAQRAAANAAGAYVGGKAIGSGIRGSEMNHRDKSGRINPEHSSQKSPFYKYGLADWVENQWIDKRGIQNIIKEKK